MAGSQGPRVVWRDLMLAALSTLAACLVTVSTFLYSAFVVLGVRAFASMNSRRLTVRRTPRRYGVSVLKPCVGNDPLLERCLESYCERGHADDEVLCGVQSLTDPAVQIIERVQARFPQGPLRLVVTENGQSLNPKVAQLEILIEHARNSVVWISDANTLVSPGILHTMLDELEQPGVGLVVNPVLVKGAQTLGARLEQLHMNAFVAPVAAMCEHTLHRVVAPGKSALLRIETLHSLGGFATLGRYLAEDHQLVEAVRALGLRTVVSAEPITQPVARVTIKQFTARQMRWSQLRWVMAPWVAMLEPLLYPMVPALLLLLVAQDLTSLGVFVTTCLAQVLGDHLLLRATRAPRMPANTLLHSLIRPWLLCWAGLRASMQRRVEWRGHVHWIGAQSQLSTRRPSLWLLRAVRRNRVRS